MLIQLEIEDPDPKSWKSSSPDWVWVPGQRLVALADGASTTRGENIGSIPAQTLLVYMPSSDGPPHEQTNT